MFTKISRIMNYFTSLKSNHFDKIFGFLKFVKTCKKIQFCRNMLMMMMIWRFVSLEEGASVPWLCDCLQLTEEYKNALPIESRKCCDLLQNHDTIKTIRHYNVQDVVFVELAIHTSTLLVITLITLTFQNSPKQRCLRLS